MAHLSNYDSDVILEVPNSDNYQTNVVYDVYDQEQSYYEQSTFYPSSDIEITSDSNIILYEQYLKETESAKLDASLTAELEGYKEQIDALKKQSKEKEDKYIDEVIDLEKQKKKLENIVYKVGFLDSGGGGWKKKKKNNSNDSPINTVTESADGDELNEVLGTSMTTSVPKVVNEGGMNEVDTTILKSFPPLHTQVTTSAGNAPGKYSYTNVTGKPSGKKLSIHTLFIPRGNGIDVVVPVESILATSDRFANTAYGFFLGKRLAYPIVANYVMNTWEVLDAMLENGPWFIRNNLLILKKWHPDENLLKEDVSTVPVWVKLHVGRLSNARVMIELRADMELKDNIVMAMPRIKGEDHYICNVCVEYEWKPPRCTSCKVFEHIHEECPKNTGAGEKKTLKKPSQTSQGVSVGPKMGFKPHKEYQPVPKKSKVSSSGNKKKGVEPTIEVSNSNPIDVLNSVDNYAELDTNSRSTNLVEFSGDYDSEDEVESVDNDMAHSLALERVDEDMYKGQEFTQEIQAICDNLDIRVRDLMNVVMDAVMLPENDNCLADDNFANELLKRENDHLMELLISQDLVHTAVNSLAAINDYKNMQKSFVDEYNETLELKTELAKKNDMIEKLKAKNVSIEKLKEHIAKLKETNVVDSAQTELLVYVSATCPSSKHVSDKLVAVTPINRTRKVRGSVLLRCGSRLEQNPNGK
ncbi:retrotransposon protein, putative, ty1-copia subclass [Tanacetum coccineum]